MSKKFFRNLVLSLVICICAFTALVPMVFSAGEIYVSPSGSASNAGTISSPTTLEAAITSAVAGTTIYMRGGTYNYSSTITIARGNNGSSSAYKKIYAYGSETPILNFSAQAFNSANRGIQLFGHYWHIKGIQVTGAGDNGMFVGGNYNIVENCILYANRDSGLQISRYASDATASEWPSYNTIKNCYSYNNFDTDNGEDADGFACKLTSGPGNVFDGCIAAYNVDDGWDLYAKADTGPIGVVTLKNCIAHNNGKTTTGQGASDGDKNGFKLGGSDIAVNHIVTNCIAFNNINHGFTFNSNPGAITLTNCTSYNNAATSGKYNYTFNEGSHVAKNCLSYKPARTSNNDHVDAISNYQNTNIWWNNGAAQSAKGLTLTDADFVSLTAPTTNGIVIVPRNADGSPNLGNFLKLASNSDLIGAGVNGANIGANFSSTSSATPTPTTASATPTPTPKPTSASPTPTPTPTPTTASATPTPTPASSGSTLFSDNFESGSYSNWTTQNGSWSVTTDGSKVFYQSSTSAEGRAWLNTSSSWTNQTVEAKVKVTSFNGSNPVLVCARMKDGNNYYAVAVKNGTLELRKKVSGSTSVLTSKSYTFSTGTWYTIKLSVVGTTLTAYVNGTQQLSTTDSSRTSGVAGLVGWKTAVKFDDVVVTN